METKTIGKFGKVFLCLVTLLVIVPAGVGVATDYVWDNGSESDNYWSTDENWDPDGDPGSGDTALIDGNYTVRVQTTVGSYSLPVTIGATPGDAATCNLTAGNHYVATLYIGTDGGEGTYNQSGGDLSAVARIYVGYDNDSKGTYELTGGTLSIRQRLKRNI